MIFLCCCRSRTASSPAQSASADLPVPADPPSETMPISGSSRASIASRCSAERPRSPKTSRSPRTRATTRRCATRPRADPRSEWMTTPVLTGTPASCDDGISSRSYRSRHLLAGHLQVGDARVARVDRELGAVLLRRHADRRRLDPERQVLRHDDDVESVVRQVHRDREDSGVVVAELQARGQHRLVGVVQLDPERPAVSEGDREVESFVFDAQFVEEPEGLPREVPDLRSFRLASSSLTTTTGRTTACSAKRNNARGSLRSTECRARTCAGRPRWTSPRCGAAEFPRETF